MNKEQKRQELDNLKDIFSGVESAILTSVQGMSVAEISDLRKLLHQSDVKFKVVKNKLTKIATQDYDIKVLQDDFVGSTAMAWSSSDAVSPAKCVIKYKKENKDFEIKSGYNAGKRLDLEQIKALAALPSLEELRAQLLGTVQGVYAKLLSQTNAPATHLVGVVQARVEKDQENN